VKAADNLLEVDGLTVGYRRDGREVRLVDDVSFHLARGEALGLAGESGCGKTTTALSLLGLLPTPLERIAGSIVLHTRDGDVNVHRRTELGMQAVRWRTVSLVFQGAMNALDPVMRVSHQIAEAIRLHEPGIDSAGVHARVRELFDAVGINPARANQYPHEFSGGMRQRVMIALALACRPELVIGDEPTTALDVMVQAQILELLESLRRDLGLSLILITHDLSVLAETCDRVAVMYAGAIVESGTVDDVFERPQHPYTQRLLGAFPAIGGERTLAPAIPGAPPDPVALPAGCRFHPRCHRAQERCAHDAPALRAVGEAHAAACLFAPWPDAGRSQLPAGGMLEAR
jgi:peptide/nickel transport system ATP-binding protein